jgi:hypothetical protein
MLWFYIHGFNQPHREKNIYFLKNNLSGAGIMDQVVEPSPGPELIPQCHQNNNTEYV